MYVPQTPMEAWIFLLILGTAAGLVFDLLFRVLWKAFDMKRRWIITVPTVVGGFAKVERRFPKRGQIETKQGDEGRTVILSGDACYPSNRGPLHLIGDEGWNLVAPTADEPGLEARTGENIKDNPAKWRRLRIWDSLTLWRACRENDMEDLYSSSKEKEHWIVKVFPFAAVLLVVLAGAFLFVIYKVLPLIAEAGN